MQASLAKYGGVANSAPLTAKQMFFVNKQAKLVAKMLMDNMYLPKYANMFSPIQLLGCWHEIKLIATHVYCANWDCIISSYAKI